MEHQCYQVTATDLIAFVEKVDLLMFAVMLAALFAYDGISWVINRIGSFSKKDPMK